MEKEFLQRGLSKLFLTSGANATSLERVDKEEHISLGQDSYQSKVVVPDKQDKQRVSKPYKAGRKDKQNLGEMHPSTVHAITTQKPLIALAGLGALITIVVLLSSKSTRNMS